ncbi:hypothetical protein DSO57_1001554 [Entomophthora muscae]|uniref:Uncharacterized protein n=1 Tax=Entomophthora muscae TaxID=34485 RepID=A0ACC2RNY7_9FUNG|nr:hypothetical protein DSO57_1001554 [Entomophthora muscae]
MKSKSLGDAGDCDATLRREGSQGLLLRAAPIHLDEILKPMLRWKWVAYRETGSLLDLGSRRKSRQVWLGLRRPTPGQNSDSV